MTFEESGPSAPTKVPPKLLLGSTVLVADDSPDMRLLYKAQLEKSGASVLLAADGIEAVECAFSKQRSPIDAVLMDLDMPRMNGLEAIVVLRERGFKAPILAITAAAPRYTKSHALRAGASDYVLKPISAGTLTERLASLLLQAQSSQEHSETGKSPAEAI